VKKPIPLCPNAPFQIKEERKKEKESPPVRPRKIMDAPCKSE
jgi:hypothetical protein